MSNVRRWAHTVQWEGLQISAAYMAINDGGEYVMHADYAALEAECANLKNSLLAITARHFAESWKKRTNDAELEQYLSAGIAQLESERDALAGELEGANERARILLDAKNHWAERARKAEAELAAIKGKEVDGGN